MTELTSGLYLGDYENANNEKWLKNHHITHIVNSAVEHKNYFPRQFKYLTLKLEDSPSQSLYHILEKSYNFIDKAIEGGGKVLVHCHAGISRSSSIVIYYLMKKYSMTLAQAYSFVKSKRKIIDPNEGFMKQLFSVTPEVINMSKVPQSPTHPYIIHASQKKRYDNPRYIESKAELLRRINK